MFCCNRPALAVLAGLATAAAVVWCESLLRQGQNLWQWIAILASH